jgi:hypothetical protein
MPVAIWARIIIGRRGAGTLRLLRRLLGTHRHAGVEF